MSWFKKILQKLTGPDKREVPQVKLLYRQMISECLEREHGFTVLSQWLGTRLGRVDFIVRDDEAVTFLWVADPDWDGDPSDQLKADRAAFAKECLSIVRGKSPVPIPGRVRFRKLHAFASGAPLHQNIVAMGEVLVPEAEAEQARDSISVQLSGILAEF